MHICEQTWEVSVTLGGLTLGGERTRKHVCSGLAANPGLYALGGRLHATPSAIRKRARSQALQATARIMDECKVRWGETRGTKTLS